MNNSGRLALEDLEPSDSEGECVGGERTIFMGLLLTSRREEAGDAITGMKGKLAHLRTGSIQSLPARVAMAEGLRQELRSMLEEMRRSKHLDRTKSGSMANSIAECEQTFHQLKHIVRNQSQIYTRLLDEHLKAKSHQTNSSNESLQLLVARNHHARVLQKKAGTASQKIKLLAEFMQYAKQAKQVLTISLSFRLKQAKESSTRPSLPPLHTPISKLGRNGPQRAIGGKNRPFEEDDQSENKENCNGYLLNKL